MRKCKKGKVTKPKVTKVKHLSQPEVIQAQADKLIDKLIGELIDKLLKHLVSETCFRLKKLA